VNRLNTLILSVVVGLAPLSSRGQSPLNPNDTIVRLDIRTEGTNFGTLEIELFDQDKPETVQNFLLYVNAGVYSNLVIHRVETNFVLQAGHVTLPKPDSTNAFTSYVPGKNYGSITNEFGVGPQLSNVFGTIAMARSPGQTNSASADWFINLNDNTNLDTIDGGFTVFGQVVNTTAANNGTNLLNFFRTMTNITGVLLFNPFDFSLNQLPFSTYHYYYTTNFTTNNGVVTSTTVTNTGSVEYQDLFTVRASVENGPAHDRTRPQVAVTDPTVKLRVTTNGTVTFQGTAKDNMEVARVLISTAASQNEIASGTANWSEEITLTPGTNTIFVKSIDRFGNESATQKRSIFYEVPTELKLTNSGAGTVVGATNLQMLDIGRNYLLSAVPAKGNFFVGWRGSFNSPLPRVLFKMQEGETLTAVFSTNYFPKLRGTYAGLIVPRSKGDPHVTGTITVQLGASGAYNGRLQLLSATYPIRGAFNLGQVSTISGLRNRTFPLLLSMQLITNGVESIVGTYVDGTNAADVLLFRNNGAGTNVPQAGHYTFVIAPQTNSVAGDGFGFGTADVSSTGAVAVNATLQDGTVISTNTILYAGAHWPLFYRWNSSSALLGWMSFATNSPAFDGAVKRVNPAFTNALENGFVTGAPFVAPTAGESPLGWTNGTANLSGDGLDMPLTIDLSFEDGAIVVGSNVVSLQLQAAADGNVTGMFVHPASGAPSQIKGVLLQGTNNLGAGFFEGTNSRSGAIRILNRE